MREVLNCKVIRDSQIEKIRHHVLAMKYQPVLSIIQVAGDKSSDVYTRNKVKLGEEIGIKVKHIVLPEDTSKDEVINTIVNHSAISNGCILQLPLPKHLQPYTQTLLDLIEPCKDVDGLSTYSIGLLHSGNPHHLPCTAQACLDVLDYLNYDLTGKNILIVGRQTLLGLPLQRMMLNRNATVTMAHSKTSDLDQMLSSSCYDVVVLATGNAKRFGEINTDIILDCGINHDENGKLCGDANLDTSHFEYATSVGGGISGLGVLTVLNLMKNTIKSYTNSTREN